MMIELWTPQMWVGLVGVLICVVLLYCIRSALDTPSETGPLELNLQREMKLFFF